MELLRGTLPDGREWWRVADRGWTDPLDPRFAGRKGGRWNPPNSFPALYLNEDIATARLNLRAFIERWPYEPEDIRDDTGPVLVACALPRRQIVCDARTAAGLRALGLPVSYPLDSDGSPVPRAPCQRVGVRVKSAGLRGVRARSAQSSGGAGRELAWFPASPRSAARQLRVMTFVEWFRPDRPAESPPGI